MPNPMTKEDSIRVMSTQAKAGHDVGKNSFAAHAQRAGNKYENAKSNAGQSASGNGGQQAK